MCYRVASDMVPNSGDGGTTNNTRKCGDESRVAGQAARGNRAKKGTDAFFTERPALETERLRPRKMRLSPFLPPSIPPSGARRTPLVGRRRVGSLHISSRTLYGEPRATAPTRRLASFAAEGGSRNQQGLGNRLIIPDGSHAGNAGAIRRRERLGGMLNYYYRQAA